MSKVIFVGLHNKPNKKPLDSSTKSGKLIDRIINENRLNAIKTNLFDCDYLPKEYSEIQRRAIQWYEKIDLEIDDIIILLGKDVWKNFRITNKGFEFIYLLHPASRRSHQQMNEYVQTTIQKIKQIIQAKELIE